MFLLRTGVLGCLAFAALTLRAQDASAEFAQLAARAAAARDAGDPAGALAFYRQALALNPAWMEGLWMSGSLQYDAGSFKDGAESLGRLVKLSPRAAPAWGLLGLCTYETGDYAAALDQIGRSLALGIPNQPQMTLVLRFHQAALVAKLGRFDEALREYGAFIPGQVTDEQVLLGLGLAELHMPLVPSEIPAARRDLTLSVGRAFSAFLANNIPAAQAAYDDLIARFPNEADAHFAYGYFLFGSDADRALEEWRRALTIDAAHAGAHAMTAWADWLRDDKSAALAHARQAIDKDPGFTVARIVLGRLTAETGEPRLGIEHLERAVREDPDNLEAHLALATAYSLGGRKLDARNERQLCIRLRGDAGAPAQP